MPQSYWATQPPQPINEQSAASKSESSQDGDEREHHRHGLHEELARQIRHAVHVKQDEIINGLELAVDGRWATHLGPKAQIGSKQTWDMDAGLGSTR